MKAEKYVLSIAGKLQIAENYNEVENIIEQAIADMDEKGVETMSRSFLSGLQVWLESLSPLDWDSTQWNCLRYALLYLRKGAYLATA